MSSVAVSANPVLENSSRAASSSSAVVAAERSPCVFLALLRAGPSGLVILVPAYSGSKRFLTVGTPLPYYIQTICILYWEGRHDRSHYRRASLSLAAARHRTDGEGEGWPNPGVRA